MDRPRLSEATARDAEIQSRIPRAGQHLGGSVAVTGLPARQPANPASKVSSPPLQHLAKAAADALRARQQRLGQAPPTKATSRGNAVSGGTVAPVPAPKEGGIGVPGQEEGGGVAGEEQSEGATGMEPGEEPSTGEGEGGPGEEDGEGGPGEEEGEGGLGEEDGEGAEGEDGEGAEGEEGEGATEAGEADEPEPEADNSG